MKTTVRMILRNSAASIARTPLKTVLFALLITAVSAFLYLGVNTWASSSQMLKECDKTFTTIAVFSYTDEAYTAGTAYAATSSAAGSWSGAGAGAALEAGADSSESGSSAANEDMRSAVAGIDFASIAENENVLSWNPMDCAIGVIEGFTAHSSLVPYSTNCVLVITETHALEDGVGGGFYAKVVDSPYCYRPDVTGKHIYLYADGLPFEPDRDAYYVIHGQIENLSPMVMSVHFRSFYCRSAALAGVDCDAIEPYYALSSPEEAYTVSDGVYASIADFYSVMNNRVYVTRTDRLTEREEFHQEWVSLIEGRMFTPEEQAEGAAVCIITETIQRSCGLEVGERVTLRTTGGGEEPATDCYWGAGSLKELGEYEIIGVVNYYDGLQYSVYVPGPAQSVSTESFIYLLGQYPLGQATIKNGTAEAFSEAVSPLLPARASLCIYDQGYQATADSLYVIRRASVMLTITAAAAALLILLCFAYLFVEKQRDAVETMRCFGTSRAESRLYLLFGAALIAAVACAAGVLIGTRYAGALISNAYRFVSELQAVDFRYSNGYLGLTKTYEPLPVASGWLAAAVAAGTFLLALLLCRCGARQVIEGRVMRKRSRTQNLRPPKRSSVIGGGALRYSLLSIARGGVRTLVVPVVSMAMLLFIATLLATSASYTSAREQLCDNTEIRGSLVNMRGKYSGSLVVRNKHAQQLIDTGYIENPSVAYARSYQYLGVTAYASGAAGAAEDVPWPDNPFTLDKLNEQMLASYDSVVFTNGIADAPEFHFSTLQATYMDGYGENSFGRDDWETLFCLASTHFMSEHGLALGDRIRIYVVNNTYYSLNGAEEMPFIGIEMTIVGSFYRQGGEDNLYCPLPAGLLDLDGLAEGETSDESRYRFFGMTVREARAHEETDMQARLALLLGEDVVSSMSFSLSDARQLTAFKDRLEEMGFSGPNQQRSIRVALMLNDADFMRSLSDIAQRSKYMEILYPVLLALSCIVGLIIASLMIRTRRGEIAAMRGMGARRSRIFASFFFEQLILLIAGSLLGAGIWLPVFGSAELQRLAPYLYAISYALGCALTLFALNSGKALALLSEKE